VQYFACEPGNGIFCPAHKVSPLSSEAPKEATARPQSAMSRPPSAMSRPPSAMSARSGRSSVAGGEYRPPSTTPSARIRSGTMGNSRPPSTTPGRTPSRNAPIRPGSSLSSRQSDYASTSRLLPRRSIADGLADEESRRRAKTSAEEAAKAEGRITAGSRAHRFLHMNAKDLEVGGKSKASDVFGPDANGQKFSSVKGGTPTSPLKDSLLGPKGMPTLKSRLSYGAMGSGTPRSAKPRTSLFGTNNGMLPPAMPGSSAPKNKNLMLLEEMDLTPKQKASVGEVDASQNMSSQYDAGNDLDLGGFAITTNEEGEDEEAAKSTRLKAELIEMTKQLQRNQIEIETIKVRAQQEAQQEWEEENKLQKEDEDRRRKDLENREKEARDRNDVLSKEVKRITEEAKRAEAEKDKSIKDTAAKLQESEQLVESLKTTLASGGAKSDEVDKRVQAMDLEMKQLQERFTRLVEEKDKERQEYLSEIDDLKAAGEEAFDIFQKEQALSNEIIQETENKLVMLEARAQEAIVEVERQRDEALQGIKPTSVAEIDHQSLQEQLSRAQKRIIVLEDEIAEIGTVMQQEREASVRRKDRFAEIESRYKVDMAKLKADYKRVTSTEAEARTRIEELMEALEESRAALENERAELEILRTEALVIGSGSHDQSTSEREKARLESEIERLNGLLEGARSGKREISRKAEAHVKEIERLHTLVEEVRSHLQIVEADRNALEEKLSVQVDASKSQPESRYSLTVPSSTDSSLQSPTMSAFGDTTLMGTVSSPGNSKRYSNNSNQSRKSRSSLGGQFPNSVETTMKEMTGLRSIVNTLNQELTEIKVNSMLKEKELIGEVDMWKEEARKWQLIVESLKASSNGQIDSKDRNQSIESRLQVEKKLQEAQNQVQTYRDRLQAIESQKQEEINKLNQDIADLEALCEATVWRREEQDAKKQELERQVAKLQRSLDRALNGASRQEEPSSSHDSMPVKGGLTNGLVCDDCGESGHLMGDDCPYNKDELLF
jgi:CAP-Gly domain-containing linker protein 1